MQTLRVDHLLLEPLLVAHAQDMFDLLRDPALYEYLDDSPPASVEQLRALYTRLQSRRSPDGAEQWLNWVLRAPEIGLIGYVQATVNQDGSAWVAYVLGRNAWGNGYASVAARCMIEHLAAHYAVRRFMATVEASNQRSIAVLRRLGFVEAEAAAAARHSLSPTERLFVAQHA